MPDLAELVFAPLSQSLRGGRDGEFVAVPGKGTPRWLLPSEPYTIDRTLAGWSPYRISSRLKWAAVRAAHRAGCLSVLPGASHVNIPGAAEIDWRAVGWSSKASPVPLVHVGTPGISRKAVVHLANPSSGACEAIVKVPLTEVARAAILHEANVLEILADENYPYAPRLLYVDREHGVATQTFIDGKAGARRFTDDYSTALRSLMLTGERTTIIGHAVEWQEELERAAASGLDAGTMTAAIAELTDVDPVPACWVHGDFAPWNIRRLPDGSVALIDWEDAQRSGLPLQDAFHFSHMQDYLFGARPRAHANDVECFARKIGISMPQCHKLEIAYLVHTYLRRLAMGEVAHSRHLLAALRVVLKDGHPPAAGFRFVASPEAAQMTSPRISSRIRSDLFSGVIAGLNSAGIPYCVLSGHENHAESNSSDVDFMFHPRDMHRVAPRLAQAARDRGAQLIQAMRHETSACYFVMAKEDGGEIGYLDPDCTADYRVHGRLWLSADNVLGRRRRREGFYGPAVPDEFAYYLIKKVLKQSVTDFQLRRLRHLYQRDPVSCRTEITKFWPQATVRAIEKALAASDLAWFQSAKPGLLTELMASTPAERFWERLLQRVRDGRRIVGRILRPTGMSVLICGGSVDERSAIVQGLLRQVAPAFRRVATAELPHTSAVSLMPRLRLAGKILAARARSTLVIGQVSDGLFAKSSSRFARLLLRPDLTFVLTSDEAQTSPSAPRDMSISRGVRKAGVVYMNSGSYTEELVRQASRSILGWLAARLERRLGLNRGHSIATVAGPLMPGRPEPASASEGGG